ncbi:MAG: hypothetical protein JO316_08255 [Abitibacteriaceae bacterium]|nr:hypothetical protein [Abditibacteriaceae bacterium]MBV9865326.1 hypothetical protein [Abditibacteriaceae bacterium]
MHREHTENDYVDEQLEQALRASMPVLPTHLRGRVLQDCQRRQTATVRHQHQTSWRWAGALTCLFLAQWLTTAYLDAQRAMLLWPPHTVATTPTLVAFAPLPTQSIRNTLQARTHTLALLLDTHDAPAFQEESYYVTKPTLTPYDPSVHPLPTAKNG